MCTPALTAAVAVQAFYSPLLPPSGSAVRIPFAHVILFLRQYFAMISNPIKGDGST